MNSDCIWYIPVRREKQRRGVVARVRLLSRSRSEVFFISRRPRTFTKVN